MAKIGVNGRVCDLAANVTKPCSCKDGVDVCVLRGTCLPYCEQPAQVAYMAARAAVSGNNGWKP